MLKIVKSFTLCFIVAGVVASFSPATAQYDEELLYPTLISVKYSAGSILIGFEPLSLAGSSYRIYRSATPLMSADDIENAVMVAEVTERGVPYTDKPDTDGRYYYAVTLVLNGTEHADLLPFQNTTLKPVEYSPAPAAVESIMISAEAKKPALVSVGFSPVQKDYTYSLYVSSHPIFSTGGVSPDIVLKSGENRFSVTIEREKPYFFLVTTANRFGVTNSTILPGKNTNSEAFILTEEKKEEKKAPPVPTVEEKKAPPKPRVAKPAVTAKSLLARNLKSNFYRGNYDRALKEFDRILKRGDLSPSGRAEINFYMGQCYFYTGRYDTAVRHFILSKSSGQYSDRAELWIERCLDIIE